MPFASANSVNVLTNWLNSIHYSLSGETIASSVHEHETKGDGERLEYENLYLYKSSVYVLLLILLHTAVVFSRLNLKMASEMCSVSFTAGSRSEPPSK